MKKSIAKYLTENVLVFDGAMGTMLMASGMPHGESPESFMLSNPDVVERIHRDYVLAGADILTTNTFGASPIRLAEFGLSDRCDEICRLAVTIAKNAAGNRTLVAGSIGPLGGFLPPFGEIDPEEAFGAFITQARYLAEAGADLLIIETMTDLREAKLALRAAKSVVNIPVIVGFAFDERGRTVTGTPPEVGAVAIGALYPVAIGSNCGGDPQDMVDNTRRMRGYWDGPIVAEPNAGIPREEGGKLIWPATPDELAEIAVELFDAGANLIGSCCGSTPDFTVSIANSLSGRKIVDFKRKRSVILTSRSTFVEVGREFPIRLVGERINPFGRKVLLEEMAVGIMSKVRREALRQAQSGAEILDVNAAISGVDEVVILPKAIRAANAACDLPIFIDSADTIALEAALEVCVGRPAINSITAKADDLESKLHLAAEYGAAIVALPLDENGIPETPEGRLALVEKISAAAAMYGLTKSDIFADPIILSAAADINAANVAIQTARQLKEAGYFTVCGLSNISHGMPSRSVLNAAFLAQIAPYLDAVIADPLDGRIADTLSASQFLSSRDDEGKRYIAHFAGIEEVLVDEDSPLTLSGAIIAGDSDSAGAIAMEQLTAKPALEIIDNEIIPALESVGRDFEAGRVFLPQVIGAATAAKRAIKAIEAGIADGANSRRRGTVLLATVEGDIHDIGKNLVGTLLSAHGFKTIDLGKSVKTSAILEAIKRENPDVVGLSALMTTTMPVMERATHEIIAAYPNIPIIIGGASVSEDYATQIGAHAYAHDAVAAVAIVKDLLGLSKQE